MMQVWRHELAEAIQPLLPIVFGDHLSSSADNSLEIAQLCLLNPFDISAFSMSFGKKKTSSLLLALQSSHSLLERAARTVSLQSLPKIQQPVASISKRSEFSSDSKSSLPPSHEQMEEPDFPDDFGESKVDSVVSASEDSQHQVKVSREADWDSFSDEGDLSWSNSTSNISLQKLDVSEDFTLPGESVEKKTVSHNSLTLNSVSIVRDAILASGGSSRYFRIRSVSDGAFYCTIAFVFHFSFARCVSVCMIRTHFFSDFYLLYRMIAVKFLEFFIVSCIVFFVFFLFFSSFSL